MKPVYVDLHIHTSENPNQPNPNYPVSILIEKVRENAKGNDFLISLTDHNMINTHAYLEAIKYTNNILIGVELHVKKYKESPPYHCHIFINKEINEKNLEDINTILYSIYPDRIVTDAMQDIPSIEYIINKFEGYDFLLLPHGGQSERTFDKAMPHDGTVKFDSTLERSLYYNQFDGFTARSNEGVNDTTEYFRRLGIHEFVNLITGSDNYSPSIYPNTKAKGAKEFNPTWMYSSPTFQGLRLSLSEVSRLSYSTEKPDDWHGCIGTVYLKNDKVDIDVTLTPGLNVVIGGSSTGKTLFVDSVYGKIKNSLNESTYSQFGVADILVQNPLQVEPYYIPQNYIVSTLSDKEKDVSAIELVRKLFPEDKGIDQQIRASLAALKLDLEELVDNVKRLEQIQSNLGKIPIIHHIVATNKGRENLVTKVCGTRSDRDKFALSENKKDEYLKNLKEIETQLKKNPIVDDCNKEITAIRKAINNVFLYSEFEKEINGVISKHKKIIDVLLQSEDEEVQRKKAKREELITLFIEYLEKTHRFYEIINKLSGYNVKYTTYEIEVGGYSLSVENDVTVNETTIVEELNNVLKKTSKIKSLREIKPDNLYIGNFLANQCKKYEEIGIKIYNVFEKTNKRTYKIVTKSGKNFDSFSAGWKCAILLDVILAYKGDEAPIIIDQPEDNLANRYINGGLIKAIKNVKPHKQIILVSHNATIPMLADAQNIIFCRSDEGIIKIRSSSLEGEIDTKSVVDLVADTTDGGKASIKKRVKKYNLKSFKGDSDEDSL